MVEDKFMEYEGYKIHYYLTGELCEGAHPVVFIGGAFQKIKSFIRFAELFEKHTQVLIVELPGTGQGGILDYKYGLNFLADALRFVLLQLELSSVYLISTSYASPVGYTFASLDPDLVWKAVLGGVMFHFPKQFTMKFTHAVHAIDLEESLPQFKDDLLEHMLCMDSEKVINRHHFAIRLMGKALLKMDDYAWKQFYNNSMRVIVHHKEVESYPSLQCPVLIFTGEHDVFTDPESCFEIAKKQHNAVFTTIKNADHLFHLECFEVTCKLFLYFYFEKPLEEIEGLNEVYYLSHFQKTA